MITFLKNHNVAISIFFTIIAVIIMAYINLSSLWITIPFAFTVIFSNDAIEAWEGGSGGYYGHAVFTGIFWIALDISAFRTNTWFGIVFLVLCITIFIITVTAEFLEEKFSLGIIASIVFYNIGKAIFHEWSFFEYALPSLIGTIILLTLSEYLGDFLYNLKEFEAANKRFQAQQQEQQKFREKYVTEDMERIEKLLGIGKYGLDNLVKGRFTLNQEVKNNRTLSMKIKELEKFNNELQNKINEYAAKADQIMERHTKVYCVSIPQKIYFGIMAIFRNNILLH